MEILVLQQLRAFLPRLHTHPTQTPLERLLAELKFELWMGDAAEIRRRRGRKQKTDRQEAQHILSLLLKDDFLPIWVPSWENRDLRQLLWHRHRWCRRGRRS